MFRLITKIGFILGIFTGVLLAFILLQFKHVTYEKLLNGTDFKKGVSNHLYEKWFKSNNMNRLNISLDILRYGSKKYTLESEYLFHKISILCVILVRNKKNANTAKTTWGKGCNKITHIHMADDNKNKMPVKKTKENSNWVTLCKAIENLVDDYHWILFVNDTTFTIIENLRLIVAAKDYKKGHYLGHAVTFWTTAYNRGRAGYVLSQGSLKQLKSKLSKETCLGSTSFLNQEDFYLGKHLSELKIFPVDTRDSIGLTTFHSYNWQHEFFPGLNYHKFSVYPVLCCSSQAITFQGIESDKMHMYYYLLYQLQVFDSGKYGSILAQKPSEEMVWQAVLREEGLTNYNISAEEYFKVWENKVHDPATFLRSMQQKTND